MTSSEADVETSGTSSPSISFLERRGTFRALRHRNYRLYFLGQMVSLVGSWMQVSALMWLAFHLTQTSRWPALVAAAQLVPTLLLGAYGGALADRISRRRLIFHTQAILLALSLLLAGLVWFEVATIYHLFVVSLAIGVVNAIDLPARLAFLVEMVGREDLINAVGLNSLMFNVARAMGPAIGAVLLTTWGPGVCFLVNGISYLAVLFALSQMRLIPFVRKEESQGGWGALKEGFLFVAAHPGLGLLMPLTAAMAILGWPILALLPALAQKGLGAGEGVYGLMLSSIGAGALCAALTVASFGSMHRRHPFLLSGLLITALALVGLSLVRSVEVALLGCMVLGFGLILFFATSQATFQLSATEHNRGRVMGIYSIILGGGNPIGNLLVGPAADAWGEAIVLRLQGLGILGLATLIFALRARQARATFGQTTSASAIGGQAQ